MKVSRKRYCSTLAIAALLVSPSAVAQARSVATKISTHNIRPAVDVSERTVNTHTNAFEPNINESEYLNKNLFGPYQAVVVSAGEVELYASDGASPFEPQRVASVSKLVTTTAVFRLVEDGKLSLDSAISDHLPFSINDRWVDVTILDLLQQHSGMPANRSSWFGGQWDTCEAAAQEALQRAPLARGYRYSNHNFCVLSLIIEQVTNRSFFDAVDDTVFTPLRMTSPVLDETYQHLAGAGAFAISAIDLALMMAALQDHSLTAPNFLTTTSKNLMRARNVWNYGTGTWVFDNGSWGHSGTLAEGRNIVVELVDSDQIVVIQNQSNHLRSGLDLFPYATHLARAT